MNLPSSTGLLSFIAALPSLAQHETSVLDTIEVTGARLTYEDLMGTPAVFPMFIRHTLTFPGCTTAQP
jgi:hypothetical protein